MMLCKNDLEDNIANFIRERVPKAPMRTIFDVGANVGWFTYQTAQQFPEAEFWLFEPVSVIFDEIEPLLSRFSQYNIVARSHLNKLALGHIQERAMMTSIPNVTINKIIESPDSSNNTEYVSVTTGDLFCKENNINHIDFLKIDVEGYDMNVLIGFVDMLRNASINFIQVESSFSPDNKLHVPVEVFSAFLGNFGYEKFRIIQQASFDVPLLMRADTVFLHKGAAKSFV